MAERTVTCAQQKAKERRREASQLIEDDDQALVIGNRTYSKPKQALERIAAEPEHQRIAISRWVRLY